MSSDDEWERELEFLVGERTWTITGLPADLVAGSAFVFAAICFGVGLGTIVNWIAGLL